MYFGNKSDKISKCLHPFCGLSFPLLIVVSFGSFIAYTFGGVKPKKPLPNLVKVL